MQELEKILEEMKISATYAETTDGYGAICVPIGTIERIITQARKTPCFSYGECQRMASSPRIIQTRK
ncbi:MAG: hypothetical protein ACLSEE_05890 [Blautia hansenii]|uniref:hypothetical protein n=1 Tax=Blautia sp. TaxID=1955243 RepID=UPI0025C17E8A|nr:hypothetical protein [Blautia sp.]